MSRVAENSATTDCWSVSSECAVFTGHNEHAESQRVHTFYNNDAYDERSVRC